MQSENDMLLSQVDALQKGQLGHINDLTALFCMNTSCRIHCAIHARLQRGKQTNKKHLKNSNTSLLGLKIDTGSMVLWLYCT